MSVAVEVLPEARQDIISGRDFFDQCRAGLGAEFVSTVLGALDRIGWMPEMHGEVGPGIRGMGIKRFGFVVYYRLVRDGVEVLAVLHGGRDPEEWQSRAASN